jgi:hypothetical protein
MTLSTYHQKYLDHTAQDMAERIHAKETDFQQTIDQINYSPTSDPVKIAVLGCGVKYFVPVHKEVFAKVLGKPVEVTTFDITIEHLAGEENVVQHDCSLPLPGGPYDITYSSILLKFIETEKQWDVLYNSYTALRNGGIAVHYVGTEEGDAIDVQLGYNHVPFARWREEFNKHNINFVELHIKTGPKLNSDETVWVLFKR